MKDCGRFDDRYPCIAWIAQTPAVSQGSTAQIVLPVIASFVHNLCACGFQSQLHFTSGTYKVWFLHWVAYCMACFGPNMMFDSNLQVQILMYGFVCQQWKRRALGIISMFLVMLNYVGGGCLGVCENWIWVVAVVAFVVCSLSCAFVVCGL